MNEHSDGAHHEQLARLRSIVHQRRVRWEISRVAQLHDARTRRCVFAVDLWGIHSHRPDATDGANCRECKTVLFDLMAIAHWVTPRGCGAGHHGGQPCMTVLRFLSENGTRHLVLDIASGCLGLPDSSDDVADAVIEDLAERLLAIGSPRASAPRVEVGIGG
jgi:hypothetical protein